MIDDLITSLRALAAARHDDLSVASDAADEIERLRAENEQKQDLIDAARVHRNDLRAEIERTYALLKDPNVVAINMLRGVIALPSVEQIKHIYASVFDERDEALEEKP